MCSPAEQSGACKRTTTDERSRRPQRSVISVPGHRRVHLIERCAQLAARRSLRAAAPGGSHGPREPAGPKRQIRRKAETQSHGTTRVSRATDQKDIPLMSKTKRIAGAFVAVAALAASGAAFTASNTVPDTVAGYGSGTITGATMK